MQDFTLSIFPPHSLVVKTQQTPNPGKEKKKMKMQNLVRRTKKKDKLVDKGLS